ncbi:ABC transporter permease [Paenibacillus sp. sgz500958]|uniref:ABC transporter permease n=1 Tax=Paenibacillus sp. sgz500958 TaxID=3242475 RepID=UPI0036D36454
MSMKTSTYAFPSPASLFRRRLFSHWREQSAIIRTAADWTVLLYLIIPGGLLGGRFYYGFWKDPLPGWFDVLPFGLVTALLLILINTGGVVLLLQEGDLMFLRQRQKWTDTILFRGLIYSLIVTSLKIAAVYAVLLPFLIRGFGLAGGDALSLLLLTLACGCCLKLLGHLVRVQWQGWRRWLRLIPAISLPSAVYVRVALLWDTHPVLVWAVTAVFIATTAVAILYRLRLRGTFINDVKEDYKQRMRIAGLLLRGVLDKPRPTRYRPWIFRKSQPLLSSTLPESRLSAASIKALVRNPGHLKLYLQFTGVSLVAIFIVPAFLKWILFIVLASLMSWWLTSFWLLFVNDEYIGILPFSKDQKAEAGARTIPYLISPFSVICSAVVCISLYEWWGLVLFIPLGVAGGFMISRLFSAMRLGR